MKLLLTSSGISNPTIRDVLVDLLGKPIAESSALFVPTAIYPFPGGAGNAFRAISGNAKSPLCGLGWKSLGVLELTALPSIDKEVWVTAVQESDALLVWGGDPVYLAYWMKHSGLADLLPSLRPEMVYVGVSAGSIAMASRFGVGGSTYHWGEEVADAEHGPHEVGCSFAARAVFRRHQRDLPHEAPHGPPAHPWSPALSPGTLIRIFPATISVEKHSR